MTMIEAQAMKKGCTDHSATELETYCRCVVDAAVVAQVPDAELRAIGSHFDDRSLRQTAEHYPKFAAFWKDCLH
jgi:hypothetical protein